jgi:hypothetical protein
MAQRYTISIADGPSPGPKRVSIEFYWSKAMLTPLTQTKGVGVIPF